LQIHTNLQLIDNQGVWDDSRKPDSNEEPKRVAKNGTNLAQAISWKPSEAK
jgi:hypothetical protein